MSIRELFIVFFFFVPENWLSALIIGDALIIGFPPLNFEGRHPLAPSNWDSLSVHTGQHPPEF